MHLSASHDLRPRFGAIRDQGARPTCLVFSASDAHAAMRSPWTALSIDYLFYHTQQRAGRSFSEGTALADILHSLQFDGQPADEDWPYTTTMPADASAYRPPSNVNELFKCKGGNGTLAVSDIIAELDKGKSPVLLLNLSQAFFTCPAQGVIDLDPPNTPPIAARHAVIAVAYGHKAGKTYVLIRNSWGASWAAQGHAWITEDYLAQKMFGIAVLIARIDVFSSATTK